MRLFACVAVALVCLGGCDDQDDAKPVAKSRHHDAVPTALLGADWIDVAEAPRSVWRFRLPPVQMDASQTAPASEAPSFDRLAAAIDANLLPPRDSVHIGEFIDRVMTPPHDAAEAPASGGSGAGEADGADAGGPSVNAPLTVSMVLTTTPWNDDTLLLWVTLTGSVAPGAPSVEISLNPKTVASWRPLGDPGALPGLGSGEVDAAMLYELIPRAEIGGDPSVRYGTLSVGVGQNPKTDRPLTGADVIESIDDAPADARFAAALAGFGALLRGDPAMRDLSCTEIIDLAQTAAQPDPYGRRAEMIALMKRAEPLIDLPSRDAPQGEDAPQ